MDARRVRRLEVRDHVRDAPCAWGGRKHDPYPATFPHHSALLGPQPPPFRTFRGTPFRAEPFGTFRGNGKLSRHPPSDSPTHARLSRPRARRAQTTAVRVTKVRVRAVLETLKELKVAHTESCAPSIFTSMPFNLTELLQKARQHSTGSCPTCGRLPSHHSVVNDENCYTHVKMPPAP